MPGPCPIPNARARHTAPGEACCASTIAGLSIFNEIFLLMRHLRFWAAVTVIIGAIVTIQFEFEYGASLKRTAEIQVRGLTINIPALSRRPCPG